jgi:hypothetical protein
MTGWAHDETEAHTGHRPLSADNASTYVAIVLGAGILMGLSVWGAAALAMWRAALGW